MHARSSVVPDHLSNVKFTVDRQQDKGRSICAQVHICFMHVHMPLSRVLVTFTILSRCGMAELQSLIDQTHSPHDCFLLIIDLAEVQSATEDTYAEEFIAANYRHRCIPLCSCGSSVLLIACSELFLNGTTSVGTCCKKRNVLHNTAIATSD